MKLHDERCSSDSLPRGMSPSPFHSPTPLTNTTNNTFITGNLTFEPLPDITMQPLKYEMYRFSYIYDYGDHSTVEEHSAFNTTHLYGYAGNYSYTVQAFAVNSEDSTKAYYTTHSGMLNILSENQYKRGLHAYTKLHKYVLIASGRVYMGACPPLRLSYDMCMLKQNAYNCNGNVN